MHTEGYSSLNILQKNRVLNMQELLIDKETYSEPHQTFEIENLVKTFIAFNHTYIKTQSFNHFSKGFSQTFVRL